MKYGSVCSGIEAASVAWRDLPWQPAWFSEIDPFCSTLLDQHYPGVTNHGDMSKIENAAAIDLLVGGTPCQAFSINGARKGLDDPRGQLSLHFCMLARELRPKWIVWENVPNVLSIDRGRAFGAFTRALAECGYHLAYRVLDLRYFGIPQRRRRVFVVGYLGDWRCAASVLFDAPSCEQANWPSRKVRGSREEFFAASRDGRCIGFTGDPTPKFGVDCVPTLRAGQGGEGVGVIHAQRFRRLTVLEWERLMGFPDGYTAVEYRGRPASDAVRKRALGNSFPVPVVQWIGERIAGVESKAGTMKLRRRVASV